MTPVFFLSAAGVQIEIYVPGPRPRLKLDTWQGLRCQRSFSLQKVSTSRLKPFICFLTDQSLVSAAVYPPPSVPPSSVSVSVCLRAWLFQTQTRQPSLAIQHSKASHHITSLHITSHRIPSHTAQCIHPRISINEKTRATRKSPINVCASWPALLY